MQIQKFFLVLLLVFPVFSQISGNAFFRFPEGFSGNCDSIPPLNQQIVDFAKSNIGHTVGRGECWDLAAAALNSNGARWDKQYKFGREVRVDKECICPGDIIQFEGVKVKYQVGNRRYEESMSHHTAIIYEIKETGELVLAHQNTNFSGRKVGLSELQLKNIVRGKYTIFRPVK
ncbi:MAG: hypothetical protein M0P58_03990 [Bacteroidales bacterium]|nr:hypothetical protein [Bacteroidales bacterium]